MVITTFSGPLQAKAQVVRPTPVPNSNTLLAPRAMAERIHVSVSLAAPSTVKSPRPMKRTSLSAPGPRAPENRGSKASIATRGIGDSNSFNREARARRPSDASARRPRSVRTRRLNLLLRSANTIPAAPEIARRSTAEINIERPWLFSGRPADDNAIGPVSEDRLALNQR